MHIAKHDKMSCMVMTFVDVEPNVSSLVPCGAAGLVLFENQMGRKEVLCRAHAQEAADTLNKILAEAT